ncbi:MAG: type IV secretion system protein VirB10 [Burkholderiaceae bacterium]|nr:type IV secretion system protein VirB10 [Burkholderiaceae bacterium]
MSTDRPGVPGAGPADDNPDAITPLEGEVGIPSVAQTRARGFSWKGIVAMSLLVLSLIVVAGLTIHRAITSHRKPANAESRLVANRPSTASAEPRRLDLTPAAQPASASVPSRPLIPDIAQVTDEAVAEPIGVRRTGQNSSAANGARRVAPEDAPVMLVSSRPGFTSAAGVGTMRAPGGTAAPDPVPNPDDPLDGTKRNLEAYQRQLQGLMATLTNGSKSVADMRDGGPASAPHGTEASSFGGVAAPVAGATGAAGGAALFGGQLQGSATPRVAASMLGNRSLTLPKGTSFTCALKTKVVTATSGFIGCQVLRNVFSDDGRVLLIERGSHMDGEYHAASVRPGTVRIPVIWTRIRTPHGVTVEIDSPGTGPLGESGIDGYVDNRWVERIGAAMLVSLINDAVQLVIQTQVNDNGSDTVILPSTTSSTSKLAEKVLDSTINIPPLIYQNQGGIVGIYVARDVDFSSVYELQALPR